MATSSTRSPEASGVHGLFLLSLLAVLSAPMSAQRSTVPTGTIYFERASAEWAMNGDGTNKLALAAAIGEPSRVLHATGRWFLQTRAVGGTYPDGSPRVELFAARDAAVSFQLTTQSDLKPFAGSGAVRWAPGDLMISWVAARFDGSGNPTAPGIYMAVVTYDGAGNPVALGSQPLIPTVPTALVNMGSGLRPEIVSHDWSPDATRLVLHFQIPPQPGVPQSRLGVHSLASGLTVPLTTSTGGLSPEWAPDGSKIAFTRGGFPSGINTIAPDGSGETTIASAHGGNFNQIWLPKWSPDARYVIYARAGQVLNDDRCDIYRARADGSAKTNLTSDLDTRMLSGQRAMPGGWR